MDKVSCIKKKLKYKMLFMLFFQFWMVAWCMKYLFYSFQISISLHSTSTDVAYVIIGKSFKFSTIFVGS